MNTIIRFLCAFAAIWLGACVLMWGQQNKAYTRPQPSTYDLPESPYRQPSRESKPDQAGTNSAAADVPQPQPNESPGLAADLSSSGVPNDPSGLRNLQGIGFGVTFGYLYGEVHELVMAADGADFPVDSELVWKMQHTLTTGANFEAQLKQIYLRLEVSFPLVLSKAKMVDRDWLFDNPPGGRAPFRSLPASAPSHYSFSDTENEFSLAVRAIFAANLLPQGRAPRLELGISFMYMSWAWRALQTQGLYFLDENGTFGGYRPLASTGDTIRYRIHYFIPALIGRFAIGWGTYGLEVLLNYSPLLVFADKDEHIVTKIDSEGLGIFGQMVWGSLTNRFWLTQNVAIHLGLQGKVLFRSRIGTLKQKNNSTGNTTTTVNAAGSEYFDIEGFAGVTFRF